MTLSHARPEPRAGKLGRIGPIWRAGGARALAEVAWKNPPLVWLRLTWWRALLKDPRVQGRLVELRGNRVRVEGLRFSVACPAIPTWRKHLFLGDRYEIEERRALARFLDPDLPVIELGGSIGVVACLVNRRLRDPERHVVVEPNPDVLALLEQNRARNRARFRVLPRAVAYGASEVLFRRRDFLDSGVGGEGGRPVPVPTTSFGAVLAEAGFERCTLVCDIEGEEVALVAHEAELLRERVATLVIETHPQVTGAEAVQHMLGELCARGFAPVFREQDTWVLLNTALAPHDGEAS